MPLHQKISQHLNKQKERIIAHVKKNHKKYIFGTGMAFGIGMLKLLAIIGVFVGINMMIGRSQASDESLHIYKQIAVFNVLDDFMHQKHDEIIKDPDLVKKELNTRYVEADFRYHHAKNMTERYRAAQDIIEVVQESMEALKKLGYVKPEDIQYFNELVYEFYQIR